MTKKSDKEEEDCSESVSVDLKAKTVVIRNIDWKVWLVVCAAVVFGYLEVTL